MPKKIIIHTPAPEPLSPLLPPAVLPPPPKPEQIIRNFLSGGHSPVPAIPRPALLLPQPVAVMPVWGADTALNGSPVFASLVISAANWTDFAGIQHASTELVFNTVLLSVQQNKSIIETQIQGSDKGAVLEYAGLNNYNITIRIIITGDNGVYPQAAMDDLVNMLNAPVALAADSWYLQTLSIYNIVIRSYEISQERGSISQQAVTIQAQSATATTLIIQ